MRWSRFCLKNADAFGYLYKKNQKEIRATIPKRDEEKLWIDSLDMVNSNMLKMYNAQGEFEGVEIP